MCVLLPCCFCFFCCRAAAPSTHTAGSHLYPSYGIILSYTHWWKLHSSCWPPLSLSWLQGTTWLSPAAELSLSSHCFSHCFLRYCLCCCCAACASSSTTCSSSPLISLYRSCSKKLPSHCLSTPRRCMRAAARSRTPPLRAAAAAAGSAPAAACCAACWNSATYARQSDREARAISENWVSSVLKEVVVRARTCFSTASFSASLSPTRP
mmetsp:Transcript_28172/g.61844  ORF Transcript_28172/g.61844 Transcript_28172/m.61844 type:complete len:209 (+) Transcript_28172:652-1278(+)